MLSKETQKALNTLLSDIRYFRPEKFGTLVESKTEEENNWNGEYKIYKLEPSIFGDEVFIKVVSEEDSYGGPDYVTKISFVQPKPKEVIVTDFIEIV